jgi:hypothetical protein
VVGEKIGRGPHRSGDGQPTVYGPLSLSQRSHMEPYVGPSGLPA